MIYFLLIKFDKGLMLFYTFQKIIEFVLYLLSGAVSKGSYINLSQKRKNLLTKFKDFEY